MEKDKIEHPPEPNYEDWMKFDYWTREEAAHLLTGVEPGIYTRGAWNFVGIDLINLEMNHPKYHSVFGISSAMRRAIEINDELGKDEDHIYPFPIIKWAIKKGFPVPQELREVIDEENVENQVVKGTELEKQKISASRSKTYDHLEKEYKMRSKYIDAAVDAALLYDGENKITNDMLDKYQVPSPVKKEIHDALKKRNLTHSSGPIRKQEMTEANLGYALKRFNVDPIVFKCIWKLSFLDESDLPNMLKVLNSDSLRAIWSQLKKNHLI